jgi:hypothetical protein
VELVVPITLRLLDSDLIVIALRVHPGGRKRSAARQRHSNGNIRLGAVIVAASRRTILLAVAIHKPGSAVKSVEWRLASQHRCRTPGWRWAAIFSLALLFDEDTTLVIGRGIPAVARLVVVLPSVTYKVVVVWSRAASLKSIKGRLSRPAWAIALINSVALLEPIPVVVTISLIRESVPVPAIPAAGALSSGVPVRHFAVKQSLSGRKCRNGVGLQDVQK